MAPRRDPQTRPPVPLGCGDDGDDGDDGDEVEGDNNEDENGGDDCGFDDDEGEELERDDDDNRDDDDVVEDDNDSCGFDDEDDDGHGFDEEADHCGVVCRKMLKKPEELAIQKITKRPNRRIQKNMCLSPTDPYTGMLTTGEDHHYLTPFTSCQGYILPLLQL